MEVINHRNSTKKKEENCGIHGFSVENCVILEDVMPDVFKDEWGAEYFQMNVSHFKRLNLYGNSVAVSDHLRDIVKKIIFCRVIFLFSGAVLRSSSLYGLISNSAQILEWVAGAERRVRTTCTDIHYYRQYHKVMVWCTGIIVSQFSLLFVNKSHKLLLPLLPEMVGRTDLASSFRLQDKELDCSVKLFSIYIQQFENAFIFLYYLCCREIQYESELIFSDTVKL